LTDLQVVAQAPAGPTRSPYRFRLYRYANWAEDGFLPLRNATVSWKRGDIGRIDASLPLQEGAPNVRPGEHLLVVEQEELPIWAGMIWAVDWNTGQAYATLRGSEWASLLKRRRIREDLNYSQVDQFDIARGILMHAQNGREFPGDLHIDPWQGVGVLAPMSGFLRDRTYLAQDRGVVWDRLSQLAQVIDGFDFFIRPHYTTDLQGEHLEFWLEFDFPAGTTQSDLVLEYRRGWSGSSVVDYSWPWDASSTVNRAEAANEETVVTAEDPNAWLRFPLLEDMVTEGGEHGVTRVETLQEHAQAYLLQDRLPRVSASLTLRTDLKVGSEILGRRVRFRATSWRHPPDADGGPGFDGELVVNEVQLNLPSDERPATTTLTCETEQWTMAERTRMLGGFRGGGGRKVEGDLRALLHGVQTQQDQQGGEARIANQTTAAIIDAVNNDTQVAPPAPPPPQPPPAPPPVQTFDVLNVPVGTGTFSSSLAVGTWNFSVPRAGSLLVDGELWAQPINWANNEGFGNGTRRATVTIDGLWTAGRQMVGGSNPNWAQTYTIKVYEWWAITRGGQWTARWWCDIAGGNQLRINGGFLRLTFQG